MDKATIQVELEHLKDDVRILKHDKDVKTKDIIELKSDQIRLEDAQKRHETVMNMLMDGLDRVEKSLARMPLLIGFMMFLVWVIDDNRHEIMAVISAIFGRF